MDAGEQKKDFSLTDAKPEDTYEGMFCTEEEETAGLKEHHRQIEEEEKQRAEEAAAARISSEKTLIIDPGQSSAEKRKNLDKQRKGEASTKAAEETKETKEGQTEEPAPEPEPPPQEKLLVAILKLAALAFGATCKTTGQAIMAVVNAILASLKGTAQAGLLTSGVLWGNLDLVAWTISLCFAWRSGYMTALSGDGDLVNALVSVFLALLGHRLPEGEISVKIRKKEVPTISEMKVKIKKFLDAGKTTGEQKKDESAAGAQPAESATKKESNGPAGG